jgi:hypothetical protein
MHHQRVLERDAAKARDLRRLRRHQVGETLTAILSRELRGRAITVNAIAPGPTATDLFLEGKSPELIDRMAKMNPLERRGSTARRCV